MKESGFLDEAAGNRTLDFEFKRIYLAAYELSFKKKPRIFECNFISSSFHELNSINEFIANYGMRDSTFFLRHSEA